MTNSILDKKSEAELQKHKSNFYLKYIVNRQPTNISNIPQNISNIPKIINNNLLLVDLDKCVGFEGNKTDLSNPLIQTAIQILELKKRSLEPNKSKLYEYFNTFQPKTYGEVYRLSKENKLHHLKQINFFHPWIHKKPTNEFRAGLFGPKDITAIQHRIIRIQNLINNISKYGYRPSNDDIIEGYLLIKDTKTNNNANNNTNNDYRFLITAGHHRVATLKALQIKKINIPNLTNNTNNTNNNTNQNVLVKFDTIRVNIKTVKETEIENWPGVKSEYLKVKDARELLNSYF